MGARRAVAGIAGALALLLGTQGAAAAPGDATAFATLPAQQHPEGAAVWRDLVLVGSTVGLDGPAVGSRTPSTITAFDRATGDRRFTWTIAGEDTLQVHGITGLALDGRDRLYAADVQGRVLRFDLRLGAAAVQEVYATAANLPPCFAPVFTFPRCSSTLDDRPPFLNDLSFDLDGNLYVTDSWQAAVWKIPPGGGAATVHLTSTRIDGAFGANGIEVTPDGRSAYLTVTGDRFGVAQVFILPLTGTPALAPFASWSDGGGADGLARDAAGRVYVSLYERDAIVVLDRNGFERERYTSALFDEPAAFAFDDARGSLVVPNHAFANVESTERVVALLDVGAVGAAVPQPCLDPRPGEPSDCREPAA